jgi:RsiW-degrading membrane proteinase PrsW (M82 family)
MTHRAEIRTEPQHTLSQRLVGALLRPWVQTLLGGLALWVILDWATLESRNINLVPTLVLLGATLGPVTFVVYVYERVRDVSWPSLLQCFVVGGALGVAAASVAEYRTIVELAALPTTAIGLIEETCKLIVPGAIFFAARYRREADGLLFGVAAGMGFAAFETMGYALTVLIASQGQIHALEQVLFTRNLLSPAGHAAWTGLVCAALWRARLDPRPVAKVAVVGTFLLCVALHALWDSATSRWGLVPVALISWMLLSLRMATVDRAPVARRAVRRAEAHPRLIQP